MLHARIGGEGEGVSVKLDELVGKTESMLAHCRSCRTDTLLNPRFFYPRRADLDLDQLAEAIHCAECGARDIELKPSFKD